MKGMSRTTGKYLDDLEHLKQSIVDILTTPIGSRIMRCEYGFNLFYSIDQPATSMAVVAQRAFNEQEVLSVYLDNFVILQGSYQERNEGFFNSFLENIAFLGEKVIVHDDALKEDLIGEMIEVNSQGFLVFRKEGAGENTIVMSGTLRKL
jgi:hypothetical protein